MGSKRLFVLVLLLGAAAFGLLCSAGPLAHSQPIDPEAIARAYLAQHGAVAGSGEAGSLELLETRESPGAHHVRFQQAIDDVPIFGAYATVSVTKQTGDVGFALDRRSQVTIAPTAGAQLDVGGALSAAKNAVRFEKSRGVPDVSEVYFPVDDVEVLAWQVVLPALQPLGDWLVVVQADSGHVLLQQNLLHFDSGRVFDPNPVVTSGDNVPPPADCDSSANANSLSAQYRSRDLLGIQDGQNRLKGQYVDMTARGILFDYKPAGQANSPTRNYSYSCSDDRFEEVMVYHHVDSTQRTIQSLGFVGASAILQRAVPAHAHYWPGCGAFYSALVRGLHFGDSNSLTSDCSSNTPFADAAEDADVIVHEYGHAIQDDQVPNWGLGESQVVEEARAIGEGFGDFLASVVSGDPCVGEWINFGQLSCGGTTGLRWLQNKNVYPEDFNLCFDEELGHVEEHCGGDIWSATLWDLVEALGNDQSARHLALKLVLDSHFYLDPLATFSEAAAAIRQADHDLYAGAHVPGINAVFAARGINPADDLGRSPYVYVRMDHYYPEDVRIRLKVGNLAAPLCIVTVTLPTEVLALPYATTNLEGSPCEPFLPPSGQQPWWLEVQDREPYSAGTLLEFGVVLNSGQRCIAADVPLEIPDDGPVVRSMVDCSTMVSPSALPSPASTPDSGTPATAVVQTATPTFTPMPIRTPTRTPTPAGRRGDANCDGSVDPVDAAVILQLSAALLNRLECEDGADVNNDERVNSLDAALVLQYSAGIGGEALA